MRCWLLGCLVLTGIFFSASGSTVGDDSSPPAMAGRAVQYTPTVDAARLLRDAAKAAPLEKRDWAANDEVSRGDGAELYAKIAPAVVLISPGGGYGTGFVVDPEGWMITNSHVVRGAPINTKTGVLGVSVFLGTLTDGMMQVQKKSRLAIVYKTDDVKDLALLKFAQKPDDAESLPTIALASKASLPGAECVAVGHPSAGMLWTFRRGEVAGVGAWPHDMMRSVAATLTSSGAGAEAVARSLASQPKRKVLLSTCAINPGDSGGPLVNSEGELIAVSFGAAKNDPRSGVSLDKLAYHVHLDEVKSFLRDRPTQPQPFVPDPWPPAAMHAFVDRDGDGVRETIVFVVDPKKPFTGHQIDLDQDSGPEFDSAKLGDPEMQKKWDFEFALVRIPFPRTFYDTDNDGRTDVVLTDFNADGRVDLMLKREARGWIVGDPKAAKMFDPSLFADQRLAERFVALHKAAAGPNAGRPGGERPDTGRPGSAGADAGFPDPGPLPPQPPTPPRSDDGKKKRKTVPKPPPPPSEAPSESVPPMPPEKTPPIPPREANEFD